MIIAKEAGLTTEETIDLVIPFGELTDKLDTLIDADDINEVLNTLKEQNTLQYWKMQFQFIKKQVNYYHWKLPR